MNNMTTIIEHQNPPFALKNKTVDIKGITTNIPPVVTDPETGLIHQRTGKGVSVVISLDVNTPTSALVVSTEITRRKDKVVEKRTVYISEGSRQVEVKVPELHITYTITH